MKTETAQVSAADEGRLEAPVRPRAPHVDAVMKHVYRAIGAGKQWGHEHIAAVEAELWRVLDEERDAERKRCAAMAGEYAQAWWSKHCASNKHMETTRKAHDDFCALQAAIRARGETK